MTLEGSGTNPTDYSTGTGTPIELIVPSDSMGLFVRRSGEGAGTTSVQNVKAVWNFTSNSLSKTDIVLVQAMAVEMVYVSAGTNTVGDGTASTIEGQFEAGTSGTPFAITNDAYAITLGGGGAGSLGNHNKTGMGQVDDFNNTTSKTLPATFPNGYAAFYCMKYEITEGQWVDFFNTLTDAQKTTRDITSATGKNNDAVVSRNTVAWTTGDATTTRRDRACNFLSWGDGAAFADWAALRPMTELEFEKACRGPLTPVASEFAWGLNTIMADASRGLSGTENGTETVTNSTALGGCNYGSKAHVGGDAGSGPLRAGIFATNGSSRASAGATYWGIMDMSGNLWERPVMLSTANGRNFTGLNGDGVLDLSGNANVTAWPSPGIETGLRGGSWVEASTSLRTSDRYNSMSGYIYANRFSNIGWRGVRGAPAGVGP